MVGEHYCPCRLEENIDYEEFLKVSVRPPCSMLRP